MKILSMTATFGKLENQTLTLQPGLNVIQAPNEWGKSTWCAFMTAMLYGIDTGARSKKGSLAEKERYAPWSGLPMSGRMELSWNGRHITIERRAKGRIPMGDFSAYETDSGLPVPELTATTCGEILLGVERSVFQRAGFIALSDLPVSQDESLRRRLNALVTTGDESSAGDDLMQRLKNLKNSCRFNRSGLLPQAEEKRDALTHALEELRTVQAQVLSCKARQESLEAFSNQLENHTMALAYAAAEADRQKVSQAAVACDAAAARLQECESACRDLPPATDAAEKLKQLEQLQLRQAALQQEESTLPPPLAPAQVDFPSPVQAQADYHSYQRLEERKRKNGLFIGLYAAAAVLLLALLLVPQIRKFAVFIGAGIALGGIGILLLCALRTKKLRNQIEALFDRYPGLRPDKWLPQAQQLEDDRRSYEAQLTAFQARKTEFTQRQTLFQSQLSAFTQGVSPEALRRGYLEALAAHKALSQARQDYDRAVQRAEELRAMARSAPKPPQPDTLHYSAAETEQLAADTARELRQLHTRLGHNLGRMEALGSEENLCKQLEAVNKRIDSLTRSYNALDMAIRTLADASAQLQRRFAPRISGQAQDIFARLTGGRYSRLTLSEDLAVSTGADTETTLRPALWRSEGTVDQLYLSLRLAVARELTPQAPLILDDALARFDDTRMAAAMEVLKQEAENKQVILFSCQSREKEYMQ